MVKTNKNIFAFAIAISVIMLLLVLTPFVATTSENNDNETINETTGDVKLTVTNWDDEDHTFDIYLDGDIVAQKTVYKPGTEGLIPKILMPDKVKKTFRHLEEGNHTFSIRWYDCDDNAYHTDSTTAEVVAGETTSIQLNIERITKRRR